MAVFRTGPFFGVDLALNMTSVLPVCFYGTFETEPFFWEGGGNECGALIYSSSSTPLGGIGGPKKDQILFFMRCRDDGCISCSLRMTAHLEGLPK